MQNQLFFIFQNSGKKEKKKLWEKVKKIKKNKISKENISFTKLSNNPYKNLLDFQVFYSINFKIFHFPEEMSKNR